MNFVFNRQKFLALIITFLTVSGLLFTILPVLASQPSTTSTNESSETEKCYTQLASNPTTTFTSTNASAVQLAIDAALSNDIVKIAGVCQGILYTDGISQTVLIDKDLTLQGGFTITNWLTPDTSSLSILDANKEGRVIYIKEGYSITLNNLQISNGDATNLKGGPYGDIYGTYDAGGGIYVSSGTHIKLKNVSIINNKSIVGAGLYNYYGDIEIEESKLNNNYGRNNGLNEGGGIYNYFDSHITISNTLFQGNTFTSPHDNFGAGIYSLGFITITDTIFKDNIAGNYLGNHGNGGAINNNGNAHLSITNSSFINNESRLGGGIINFAVMTITNSTFSQNSANVGGAIDNGFGSQSIIEHSTIDNNNASRGAGIDNDGGHMTIANSTISGNSAAYGAAIRTGGVSSFLKSLNNTIVNNAASNTYGGTLNIEYNAKAYLSNTIIADNFRFDCAFYENGVIVSEGHNIDSDSSCFHNGHITDITTSDIKIAELADNGGETFTHALLPISPAMDAGDCSNGFISVDQRGVSRPQNDSCDIGAFESQIKIFKNYLPTTIRP